MDGARTPSRWLVSESWWLARREFFVDAHGMLRRAPRRRYVRRPRIRAEALVWAGERRIGLRGERAYWMERTTPPEEPGEPRYRQGRELDADELRYLRTLNAAERASFVMMLDHPEAGRVAAGCTAR